MRRKCHTCLCRTCLNTCCDRKNCIGKKESCENYSGFRQLSIFEPPPEPEITKTPRHPLKYYGLTDERVEELERLIRSGGRYAHIASQAAHTANETIAEYILLSINKNLSYEGLEKLWGRGEIERIPYCRTDFYGIRRYFMACFDKELRRIEE